MHLFWNRWARLPWADIWRPQLLKKIGNSPNFGHIVHWRCLLDRSQNRGMIMSAKNYYYNHIRWPKKKKIAQKLISNSNLINFPWNMNALEAPSLYMFNFAFLSREDYNKDDLCKLMQFSQNCPKSPFTIFLNWPTLIIKDAKMFNLNKTKSGKIFLYPFCLYYKITFHSTCTSPTLYPPNNSVRVSFLKNLFMKR